MASSPTPSNEPLSSSDVPPPGGQTRSATSSPEPTPHRLLVPGTPLRVTPCSKLRHLVQPTTLFPEAIEESGVETFFSSSPLLRRRYSDRVHISPVFRRKWEEDLCSPLRESRKQPRIVFPQESALKLENFVFGGELGRGSYAVVKKVISPDLRTYALKQIEHHCSSIRRAMQMLEREYGWHMQLEQCPYVVRSQGLSLDENNCFMLLEYCEGGSLDGEIARRRVEKRPFSEAEARRLTAHMLEALDAVHNIGGVHGDVKPANIMIAAGPIYKLGDFGNALQADHARFDFDPGDQRYFARELLAGVSHGVRDPAKADVFSLGLTLWEALTLIPAPPNSEPAWHMLRDGNVPVAPQLSQELNNLIKDMLHPDVDARLSVAAALAQLKAMA